MRVFACNGKCVLRAGCIQGIVEYPVCDWNESRFRCCIAWLGRFADTNRRNLINHVELYLHGGATSDVILGLQKFVGQTDNDKVMWRVIAQVLANAHATAI